MTKETKKRTRKAKTKTKAKAASSPMPNPQDPIADIAARAEGGKVAVIERGSKAAKVLDLAKGNGADAAKKPEMPEPIPMTEDAKESIQGALQQLQNCDMQLARLRQSYLAREKDLIEQRDNFDRELTALIKSQGRRFKVPENYVLDLDTMRFVPQPPRGMMGPQRA